MIRKTLFFVAILFIIFFLGCNKNPFRVDVSEISVDLKVERLDQDLFHPSDSKLINDINRLDTLYGDFLEWYTADIIRIGIPGEGNFNKQLIGFVNDTIMREVFAKVDSVYPDFEPCYSQLEEAFKHFKYYYPDASVPAIYPCMSGLNQSIIVTENAIGIALDKYLGEDCRFYKYMATPQYLRRKMEKWRIAPDVMGAWAMSEYLFNDSVDNLLNNMIYHGIINFHTKSMMPEVHDSIIFGFTNKQLEWCKGNEQLMWTYLIGNDLLYDTNRMTIRRYIADAPFTTTFTQDSPGRAAVWVGYRIVCAYMDKTDGITLSELMQIDDYQRILQGSGYHPD